MAVSNLKHFGATYKRQFMISERILRCIRQEMTEVTFTKGLKTGAKVHWYRHKAAALILQYVQWQ